jgi:hypothetical protein
MSGWGNFFGKIADQFSGRIERIKNEKVRLENERKILISKEFSASGSRRVIAIDARLLEINNILGNSAKD